MNKIDFDKFLGDLGITYGEKFRLIPINSVQQIGSKRFFFSKQQTYTSSGYNKITLFKEYGSSGNFMSLDHNEAGKYLADIIYGNVFVKSENEKNNQSTVTSKNLVRISKTDDNNINITLTDHEEVIDEDSIIYFNELDRYTQNIIRDILKSKGIDLEPIGIVKSDE